MARSRRLAPDIAWTREPFEAIQPCFAAGVWSTTWVTTELRVEQAYGPT